jgi:hypothetical protein
MDGCDGGKFVYDFSDLSCDHHVAIVAGLGLLPARRLLLPESTFPRKDGIGPRVLVIGLGGGCLPMFLHRNFPAVSDAPDA